MCGVVIAANPKLFSTKFSKYDLLANEYQLMSFSVVDFRVSILVPKIHFYFYVVLQLAKIQQGF